MINFDKIPEEFTFEDIKVADDYSFNNNKMTNEDFVRHIKSAVLTFVSMFLLTVSVGVLSDGFTYTKASLLALCVSAVIAGVRGLAKLLVESLGVKT